MIASEVKTLLRSIAQLDDRVKADPERVIAWCAVLPPEVSYQEAITAVVNHYRESTLVIMPSMIVEAYRTSMARRREVMPTTAAPVEKVPMPEWFKAAVEDMRRPPKGKDGEPMTVGQIFSSALELAEGTSPPDPLDAHCGRAGCVCTHGAGCYRGWLDGTPARPCTTCRRGLSDALDAIPPLGLRTQAHYAELRMREVMK